MIIGDKKYLGVAIVFVICTVVRARQLVKGFVREHKGEYHLTSDMEDLGENSQFSLFIAGSIVFTFYISRLPLTEVLV